MGIALYDKPIELEVYHCECIVCGYSEESLEHCNLLSCPICGVFQQVVGELVYRHEYDLAKTYRGKAEQCTTKVTINLPDQLFAAAWVTERIADEFENEVLKQGAKMLNIEIYEDRTPTWTTDYYVVATATKPALVGAVASPLAWFVILGIVLGLVIIFIAVSTWFVIEVKDIDWSKPVAAVGMALGIAAIIGSAAFLALILARKRG